METGIEVGVETGTSRAECGGLAGRDKTHTLLSSLTPASYSVGSDMSASFWFGRFAKFVPVKATRMLSTPGPISLPAITITIGICWICIGCSRSPENYVATKGVFLFEDGEPLTGVRGLVRFTPVKRASRAPSFGQIKPDGRFQLWTYEKEHGDRYGGLPAGDYNVVLLVEDLDPGKPIVKEKYQHFEETPWRATVTEDGENDFTFRLERNE